MSPHRRSVRALTWAILVSLGASGCWFSFRAEDRICHSPDDCDEGYTCTVVADGAPKRCLHDAQDGGLPADVGIDEDGGAGDGGVFQAPRGPQLAIGDRFACAINAATVVCWGYNADGRLGTIFSEEGTTTDALAVDFGESAPEHWVAVAAGLNHACALSIEGQLWCWGSNTASKLGRGEEGPEPGAPGRVGVAGDQQFYRSVGLQNEASCALSASGTVFCWGFNDDEVLGIPGIDLVQTPVEVTGMDRVSELECGSLGCCAQRLESTYCWGWASLGTIASTRWYDRPTPRPSRVTVPAPLDVGDPPYFPIALGSQNTCGVGDSGALHCWGHAYEANQVISSQYTGIFGPTAPPASELPLRPTEVLTPEPGSQIVALALTGDMICVLIEENANDRRLYCWGQVGDAHFYVPTPFSPEIRDWQELSNSSVDINRSDDDSICGLRATGDVLCIGARLIAASGGAETEFTATGTRLQL